MIQISKMNLLLMLYKQKLYNPLHLRNSCSGCTYGTRSRSIVVVVCIRRNRCKTSFSNYYESIADRKRSCKVKVTPPHDLLDSHLSNNCLGGTSDISPEKPLELDEIYWVWSISYRYSVSCRHGSCGGAPTVIDYKLSISCQCSNLQEFQSFRC